MLEAGVSGVAGGGGCYSSRKTLLFGNFSYDSRNIGVAAECSCLIRVRKRHW